MKQGKVLIKKEKVNIRDSSRIKNCLECFNEIANCVTEYPYDLEEWKEEDYKICVSKVVNILLKFKYNDDQIMM